MMIKIEIKNRFTDKIIFEFSKENNTIKDTVEEAVKNNVSLNNASLNYASLNFASLNDALLNNASLNNVSLNYASLNYALLNKRYISITRIGSSNRMTTYCFDDDIIWCGCFKGTLKEFENKVNKTHKDNELYLKQYLGAINYIKSLK